MKILIFSAFIIFCCTITGGHGLGLDCTRMLAPCKIQDKSIRFFIIGDWGGNEKPPYTTGGELQCANLIGDMSVDKRPQFFVSTGDNFYEYGVQSVDDPRFKTTFDDVFLWGKEEKVPWYVTQGNHDWIGNSSAQVAYTYVNDRWVSPSFAFSTSYDARPNGPSIDMLFIDTIVLCGNTWNDTDDDADYVPTIDKRGKKTDGYYGPAHPMHAASIWLWAEIQMARSKADYLFVVGHYPAFASDWHNVSHCLVPRLQNLMEKYNVSGYISGHAHNMQHVKTISRTSGVPIHHVVSGAGHQASANFKPVFWSLIRNPWRVTSEFFFPPKIKGFPKTRKDVGALVYVELGPQNGTFEYYKCDGELKYSFQLQARTPRKV